MKKKCTKCFDEKPFDGFYKKTRHKIYPNTAAGYSDRCKECLKQKSAEHRQKKIAENPYWQIEQDLKSNHGITLKEWNDLFLSQEGKCLICLTHQSNSKKRLRVDHCHSSGKIRGLLCDVCNIGIGMFKDNTNYLNNAIKYLNNYSVLAAKSNVVSIKTSTKVG